MSNLKSSTPFTVPPQPHIKLCKTKKFRSLTLLYEDNRFRGDIKHFNILPIYRSNVEKKGYKGMILFERRRTKKHDFE